METNQDNKNKTTSPKKKAATSRRTVGGASKAYFQCDAAFWFFDAGRSRSF